MCKKIGKTFIDTSEGSNDKKSNSSINDDALKIGNI